MASQVIQFPFLLLNLEVCKGREKVLINSISREQKELFDEIRNIFYSF